MIATLKLRRPARRAIVPNLDDLAVGIASLAFGIYRLVVVAHRGDGVAWWGIVFVVIGLWVGWVVVQHLQADLGRAPLLTAERLASGVRLVAPEGTGEDAVLDVPVGTTLWYERVDDYHSDLGSPGNLALGIGQEYLSLSPTGAIRAEDIKVITRWLKDLGIDLKEAPDGLEVIARSAVKKADEEDEATRHWPAPPAGLFDTEKVLERGRHRVIGPTPTSRMSVIALAKGCIPTAILAVIAVALYNPDPLASWFPGMWCTFVGFFALVSLAELVGRLATSLGLIGTLHIRVGKREVALRAGAWLRRQPWIVLHEGDSITVHVYSDGASTQVTKPRRHYLVHWVLLNDHCALPASRRRGYNGLEFDTFYIPSMEALAALRAALQAHGVTMRYRAREPD